MHWSGSRFRRVALLAFITALGMVAPSRVASLGVPGERVLKLDMDPRTRQVARVFVGLPTRLVDPEPPVFQVKTQAGSTTTWHIERVYEIGDAANVVLVSDEGVKGPTLNDTAVLTFVDKATGTRHVLPLPLPGPIPNASFSQWTAGYPHFPEIWSIAAGANVSYGVEQLPARTDGVRVSVAATPIQHPGSFSPPRPGSVASVRLAQHVKLNASRLRVRLRPYQTCALSPQGRILSLVGVAVRDTAGRRAIFCLGSMRVLAVRRLPGGTVVVMVPGRIGSWNDVIFDLQDAWPQFVPHSDRAADLTLELLAEIDATKSGYLWITLDVASILVPL